MRLILTFMLCVMALPAFAQTVLTAYTATNGGILYVVVTNVSTNGTWSSFGLGPNNTLTGNEMVKLDVLGNGFSPVGAVQTSKARRLVGTSKFPGLYPATNAFETSPDGFVATIQIAMQDVVFRGETLSLTISNGLYTQGGRSNSAASGLIVTNLSFIDYTNARPVLNWITPPFVQSTGSHFLVELLASHWSAIYDNAGRPIQAIEMRATDESGHSLTQILTQCFFDYNKWGVGGARFAWNIPTSIFGDTNLVTVQARTLPYFGTNAVIDTSDGVYTAPSPNYCPLKFLNDPNGTYGGGHCNVSTNTGDDATGVVTNLANWNTNRAPFLTTRGAALALARYHSNFFGRLDVGGGTIHYESEGHRMGGTNLAAGQRPRTYVYLTPYPGLTAAQCYFYTNHLATDISDLIWVRGMGLTGPAVGTGIIFDGVDCLVTEECDFSTQQSAALNAVTNWCSINDRYFRMAQGITTFSASTGGPSFVRDPLIAFTNTATTLTPILFRPFKTNQVAVELTLRQSSTAVRARPCTIWAYGWFLNISNNTTDILQCRRDILNADYIGQAYLGNLVETRAASQAGILDFGSSGSTSNMPNVMLFGNTFTPKVNWFYDDGTTVLPRVYSPSWVVGNFMDDTNIKGDEFATANGARYGNRPQMWGVGFNHNLLPETFNIGTPGSFQQFYYGLASFGTNQTTTNIWVQFKNSARYTTAIGAGGGTYSYLSTSPAFKFIGPRVLSHKLDGPTGRYDPPGAFTAGDPRKGAFF